MSYVSATRLRGQTTNTAFAPLPLPGEAAPDPSKHVNYTFGMLLGVDDFKQEFAYLSGRDQCMARDALGYGTLSGLSVSLDKAAKGPRLSVTCGSALSPRGQLICVHPAQCANLNDWLTANQQEVQKWFSAPPQRLKLYLVLCYRSCPVDPVPIPGEPCRSADDLMAPSRLLDDFKLELRLQEPLQFEEVAIREFVRLLNQIEISAAPGASISLSTFEKAVRAGFNPASSPIDPANIFRFGPPLLGIRIPPAKACEYLELAFRIWTTEIRPLFHASCVPACSCDNPQRPKAPADDECLLLAELEVPLLNVGPGVKWQVDDTQDVTLDQSRRPLLLHTRMLQEWMLCGPRTK